jgi:hypothetical protein
LSRRFCAALVAPGLGSYYAMKSLIAIVTGLHVLAHGIFGCCDHGLAKSSPTGKPCACHHAHDHDHEGPSPSSRGAAVEEIPSQAPHQCVHASCHWLAISAGASVKPLDFSSPIPFVAIVTRGGETSQTGIFWPEMAAARSSAPPLRLHLALGVLLI